MTRMYFRRKKDYDYGLTVGRLYRYGKGQVAIFVTKEEEKDKKLLQTIRRILKGQIDPCKEGKHTSVTFKANEIHRYLIEQSRKDK